MNLRSTSRRVLDVSGTLCLSFALGCGATIPESTAVTESTFRLSPRVRADTMAQPVRAVRVSPNQLQLQGVVTQGEIVFVIEAGDPEVIPYRITSVGPGPASIVDVTSPRLDEVYDELHIAKLWIDFQQIGDPRFRRFGTSICGFLDTDVLSGETYALELDSPSRVCLGGGVWLDISLTRVEAIFDGSIDIDLYASASAGQAVVVNKSIPIVSLPPIPWAVPPLEGTIVFDILADGRLHASSGGHASLEAHVHVGTEAGFRVEPSGIDLIGSADVAFSARVSAATIGSTLNVELGPRIRGSVFLSRLLGPQLSFRDLLAFKITAADCETQWSVYNSFECLGGMRARRLFAWVPEFEAHLFPPKKRTLAGNKWSMCAPGEFCAGSTCVGCVSDAHCDDGRWCNGLERCQDGVCEPGARRCASYCDEASRQCDECRRDLDCLTDDPCLIGECVDGRCKDREHSCDDDDLCTLDRCDNGHCEHLDLECDDDDEPDCRDSLDCDDRNPCTLDRCVGGHCANTADDTLSCPTASACLLGACRTGSCVVEQKDCGRLSCDPSSGACIECLSSAECDDLDPCSLDRCTPQRSCTHVPKDCGSLACSPSDGACVACLHSQDCDDGLFCTGSELCTGGVCVAGSPPCPTNMVCSEPSQRCEAGALDDCFLPVHFTFDSAGGPVVHNGHITVLDPQLITRYLQSGATENQRTYFLHFTSSRATLEFEFESDCAASVLVVVSHRFKGVTSCNSPLKIWINEEAIGESVVPGIELDVDEVGIAVKEGINTIRLGLTDCAPSGGARGYLLHDIAIMSLP